MITWEKPRWASVITTHRISSIRHHSCCLLLCNYCPRVATTGIQGRCLFLWKACRYQRWLNKVHTGEFDRCWHFNTCNLSIFHAAYTTIYRKPLRTPGCLHQTSFTPPRTVYSHMYHICTHNWFGLMEQFGWTRIGVLVGINEHIATHYFYMAEEFWLNSTECFVYLFTFSLLKVWVGN